MALILTDQNVDERLSSALRQRLPGFTIVSIRHYGYATADDPLLLEFVASLDDAFLVTQDAKTVPIFAAERVERGDRLARTIIVPTGMSRSHAVDEIELVVLAAVDRDWHAGYIRLPL